tara:strand:+ start:44 stop:529 length:486 start_codon:yes stop_codon:yes gene_type:complete
MKSIQKLILLLLFIPLVNLFSQELDIKSERYKLVSESLLLDRMSGRLYTNNLFTGVKSWEYANNDSYFNKVRFECNETWCELAIIDNNPGNQLVWDVLSADQYGYILINTSNGDQYVSNFLSWKYSDKEIQEVIKAKGGINGIPKFLSIMINCPEGRWCGL